MDFSKFTKLSSHARNFHDFLGDVLEGEREIMADVETTHGSRKKHAPFAARSDVENSLMPSERTVAQNAARAKGELRFEDRFAAMAPFFEAGFIFEQTELDETRLRSMFLFGQVFVPKGKAEESVPPNLPEPGFEGVRRGRIEPLLATYRLEGLKNLHDGHVFAMSVRRGVVVLLVCNRPHPWQVGMIEKAYGILSVGKI